MICVIEGLVSIGVIYPQLTVYFLNPLYYSFHYLSISMKDLKIAHVPNYCTLFTLYHLDNYTLIVIIRIELYSSKNFLKMF